MSRRVKPYGSWPSPIAATDLAAAGVRLSEPTYDGSTLYWLEFRATTGVARLVRRTRGAAPETVTPEDASVRTRCHEYGGGSYTAEGGVVIASLDADRRLYRLDAEGVRAISPSPPAGEEWRYADMRIAPDASSRRGWVLAVRERHAPDLSEPVNELVWIGDGVLDVARRGRDFYAAPRLNRDGSRAAWVEWGHPDMPWNSSECWVADVREGELVDARCVAGGDGVSVFQPTFAPDGTLHLVTDETGWWNLYEERADRWAPLAPGAAEFGTPQWVFGLSTYALLAGGRIAAVSLHDDREWLGVIEPGSGRWAAIDVPFTNFGYGCRLVGDGAGRVAAVAGSPETFEAVVEIDVEAAAVEIVAESRPVPSGCVWSVAESVSFDGPAGEVFGYFYPPTSATHDAPADERPPLVVMGHGGPTSRSSSELDLALQFWTSRGFAVMHTNYSGSTGYGRAYRERLDGEWGVLEVADSVAAAAHLAACGRVDPARMVIRGGSAGGFTALAAVAFHDTFAAAVSRYGVADLELLAAHTHKFEARYLDRLVGPYPEAREIYRERSPIHHVAGISVPVLLLQGADDRVVPPEQARILADSLRASGRPVAHVEFEGEGHGFRGADAVVSALELELVFYGRILGFQPDGELPPIEIAHFPV